MEKRRIVFYIAALAVTAAAFAVLTAFTVPGDACLFCVPQAGMQSVLISAVSAGGIAAFVLAGLLAVLFAVLLLEFIGVLDGTPVDAFFRMLAGSGRKKERSGADSAEAYGKANGGTGAKKPGEPRIDADAVKDVTVEPDDEDGIEAYRRIASGTG